MKAAERGSLIWFMFAITQIWLSIKLMDQVNEAITALFGTSIAACFILGVILFRQEQRQMLLNPLGNVSKEVHQEIIDKQGKGFWFLVGAWILLMAIGSIFF